MAFHITSLLYPSLSQEPITTLHSPTTSTPTDCRSSTDVDELPTLPIPERSDPTEPIADRTRHYRVGFYGPCLSHRVE